MIPPFEQHGIAYQLEPWRERETVVLEHSSQFLLGHVSRVLHLVRIGSMINIRFHNQDVID